MADIAKDALLKKDDALLEGVSKLLGYLWREAWRNAPATLNGDADALHDMRVSVRRLRTLLQNLEGKKKSSPLPPHLRDEMKKFRRRLNALGDALGDVRDHDVLDEYLSNYANERLEIPVSELTGLANFKRFLQTERAAAFGPMVKIVNRAQRPDKLRELFARFALGLSAATSTFSLEETARAILARRLDEVFSHAAVLDDADDEEGHHELRKSLKRVRYTLEAFAPCFDETTSHLKTLVNLQDQLGEMNDRIVLREKVLEAVGKEVLPDDLQRFLDYGDKRRSWLLGRVRANWKKQSDAGFFDALRKMSA